MAYDFYDTWEFTKINNIIKTAPMRAKKEFEEYFKDHPEDYSARPYYIYCLIILRDIKKAEKELKKLVKDYKENPHYAKQDYKIKLLKSNLNK